MCWTSRQKFILYMLPEGKLCGQRKLSIYCILSSSKTLLYFYLLKWVYIIFLIVRLCLNWFRVNYLIWVFFVVFSKVFSNYYFLIFSPTKVLSFQILSTFLNVYSLKFRDLIVIFQYLCLLFVLMVMKSHGYFEGQKFLWCFVLFEIFFFNWIRSVEACIHVRVRSLHSWKRLRIFYF